MGVLSSCLTALGILLELVGTGQVAPLAEELLGYITSLIRLAPARALHCVLQVRGGREGWNIGTVLQVGGGRQEGQSGEMGRIIPHCAPVKEVGDWGDWRDEWNGWEA